MKTYSLLDEMEGASSSADREAAASGNSAFISDAAERPGSATAAFLERAGHRVFEADGVYWGHVVGPLYASLPFHLLLDPELEQLDTVLRRGNVAMMRYASRSRRGMESGLYLCNPQGYSLSNVDRRQRSHVKRGLETCEFRRVEERELLVDGYQLNLDTMGRQQRFDPDFGDQKKWRRMVEAFYQTPQVTVEGAYCQGRLSVYMVCCRDSGSLQLLYKMSRSSDLGSHASPALDYHVITQASRDPGIRAISNSYAAMADNDGLDRYKRQMGFTLAPLSLCIHIHPWLSPALTHPAVVKTSLWMGNSRGALRRVKATAKLLEAAAASREDCQHPENRGLGAPAQASSGAAGSLVQIAPPSAEAGRAETRSSDGALQPGDWVEVKSPGELRAMLGPSLTSGGLRFTPEMWKLAGKRFRVFKKVHRFYLEEAQKTRLLSGTVSLEGVYCSGAMHQCDRSCFLLWREDWLRKVPSESAVPVHAGVNVTEAAAPVEVS
jgi:hypothetical protein